MRQSVLRAVLLATFVIARTAMGAAAFEFNGPEQEQRFQALTAELRCLVCQNQSLADSHADLAGDLRREVQRLVLEGKSDQDIIEFMTQRYGEFVLYRPRLQLSTLALWFGPLAILLIGAWRLVASIRQRAETSTVPLSAAEQRKAAELLASSPSPSRQDRNH